MFVLKNLHPIVVIALIFCLGGQGVAAGERGAAIASAHPLATYAGLEIINNGGNAFDAAVAISAALAVVEPAGSGLGGGGFWLLHRAKDGFEMMIDGREKAPYAAHKDMYLDKDGKVIEGLSRNGPLSAGIPGVPAALVDLAEHYGRLSLQESLRPAIRYARDGFPVSERYRKLMMFRFKEIQKNRSAGTIFLNNGKVPEVGWVLRQPDLARTLELLASKGHDGFYSGVVAAKLVNSVRAAGGIWSQKDLAEYHAVERKPVKGNYHGISITGPALPSSGGIGLIESLNILSGYDLTQFDEITRKHIISEAMRRAYHDRALYLGDSDFIDVPVERLLDQHYAAGIRTAIRPDKALPSALLAGDVNEQPGGDNTTHFSVMDAEGNRVSATLSINFPFGSGFVAEGTGVLLNDEMDDFVSLPGAMNGYGLVGGLANAIEPGKRMLSSMAPTFLEDEHRIAVLGTPGGSRIISMVLLATLDFAAGNDADSWVRVPRYHHQYIPDTIQYEKGGLTDDEIEGLSALGHQFKETAYRYGDMQAIEWRKDTRTFSAASDPRGEGLALSRSNDE